jgi:hypothetical protein
VCSGVFNNHISKKCDMKLDNEFFESVAKFIFQALEAIAVAQ